MIKSISYPLIALSLFSTLNSCKVKQRASKIDLVLWTPISASILNQSKDSLPKNFLTYKLNENELRLKLSSSSQEQKKIIEFPMPDGSFATYSLIEVQVMSPALAAKYPSFKTYEGIEISNIANRARVDVNDKNFHAYFMTSKGEFFITPVDGDEKNYYMVFRKEDSPFPKMPFEEGKH